MVLSMKKSFNKDLKSEQIEELHYGPGIVSKLRCRYMSLTLNQGCTKQRPSLNFLRRSTSLNNLIEVSDTKVVKVDPVHKKTENEVNGITQSYETLLETNKVKNVECIKYNCETPVTHNQNDQPPPDVVKEKLRIFEPNWMNTKKVHYPKKYVINKHVNALNTKNVNNIREKYQENDECIPIFASKVDKVLYEKPVINNANFNKHVFNKTLDKHKSDIEKQSFGQHKGSKTAIEDISKKSQKPPHITGSVESPSMVFNFSKRKEIPSHLPDVSSLDDRAITVVDCEDNSSPSNFEFINANIVFEGKSCMKTVGRNVKLKIKFNDLLTSTFEYPSENCLFETPTPSTTTVDLPQENMPVRSKVVLVVSKSGTETTDDFTGCKTDSKAFWSDETHSTDILF